LNRDDGADHSTETVAMNDQHYAIVVGIRYPGLWPLLATLSDATAFIRWLKQSDGGGLPDANIAAILSEEELPENPLDAIPVREHIDRALVKFGVGRGNRIGKRLYFYFAGHGFGPSFSEVAMLMANASDNYLNSNLGLQSLLNLFNDSDLFEELVVILDCCRDPNPPNRRVDVVSTGLTPLVTTGGNATKQLLIMAASYGEKAYELAPNPSGERRGLLTRALLEGLTDPTRADANGCVTADSLSRYIKERVPELAMQGTDPKLNQKPDMDGRPYPLDIVFARHDRVTVPVRIVAPSGLTGSLVVKDSKLVDVATVDAATATVDQPPQTVTLTPNIWYAVAHRVNGTETGYVTVDWSALEGSGNVFNYAAPQ
jgi:hypothetical protein